VMEQSAPFESNLAALHDLLMDQVRARSAERLSAERWQRNAALTFVAAMMLTAILLASYFTRALTRSMRRVVKTFTAIEAGQYDNEIIIDSEDETGKVLRSLDKMQTTLRGRIEADRAALAENQRMLTENRRMLAENTRVRQALDKAGTVVLVVDESHQIVYANEAAKTTFAQLQNDLKAELPAFAGTSSAGSPINLIGSSIDIFRPIPCLDRPALAALRGPQTETLSIGGHTLVLSAAPIIGGASLDAPGARLGTVLEWRSRTREVALEHEVRSVVEEALNGNLRARLPVEGKTGFHANLAGGLNEILENLSTIVRTTKLAVVEIRSSADEIAHGNAELSGRTQTQASALEETGTAMEQMTATVKQNADNAAHADHLAATAREHAEKGGQVVSAAIAAMNEINGSSRKIADIIGVIDAIAFQTNLLALNAAVEAARAGEQGRGFAVVASEVRGLARRSAEAAQEIKTLIRDSVVKVEEGAKLVDQSGVMLHNIVSAVQNVNQMVAEIASASREQSTGISEVNTAIAKIDEMTGKNSTLVEQDAAAAQVLLSRANDLSSAMDKYRITESAGRPPNRRPVEATTTVHAPAWSRRISAVPNRGS
jgi:methyl-accepting chemotaxis protein